VNPSSSITIQAKVYVQLKVLLYQTPQKFNTFSIFNTFNIFANLKPALENPGRTQSGAAYPIRIGTRALGATSPSLGSDGRGGGG
jgi:hypothetical protein